MHGNMQDLKDKNLRGQIQIYPHCFNLEISGTGSAIPEGVNFPGAYKPDDPSFKFQPFMTYGNDTRGGTEHNSKFVSFFIRYSMCIMHLMGSSRSHQDRPFIRANTTLLPAHGQSLPKLAFTLPLLRSSIRI